MSNQADLLKKRVQGKVFFQHYQDGNLFYTCQDGFCFPVSAVKIESILGKHFK